MSEPEPQEVSTQLRKAAESRIGWRHEGIVVVHRSLLLQAAEALDNSVPKEDWLRAYNAWLTNEPKPTEGASA